MIWDFLIAIDTGFGIIGFGTVVVLTRKAIVLRKALGKTRNTYQPTHSTNSPYKAPTEADLEK